MSSSIRRTLPLLLTITTFTTQVALGSAPEANFWAERQKKLSVVSYQSSVKDESYKTENCELKTDNQLASLPTSILNQLPSIGAALPTTPQWMTSKDPFAPRFSKKLQALVDAIPLNYGSVQDVNDSGDDKTPPVVLVQDVHMNTEAQTNIASLLQELINQKKVGVVGVEGAFSEFDFKPFREFPDKKITKEVTEAFLNKNLLAAPSYVGITSPVEPPLFIGVDDRPHYDANVQAYLDSRPIKERVNQELSKQEAALLEAKKKTFSPALLQFDGYRAAYAKGDIGLGAYLKKLYSSPRFLSGEGREGTSFTLDQFLEAYQMETTLNFERVEAERRRVIEKLTKLLNEKEISELVAQSLAYRMGRIGFGRYYQGVKNLCEEKGVRLNDTPAFDDYIRYVLLSEGIKAEALFAEVKSLEEKIVANLAVIPEEKKLIDESNHLALTEKLVEFSLTPEEWGKYRAVKRRFLSPKGRGQEWGSLFLNSRNPVSEEAGKPHPYPLPVGEGHQILGLASFEQFYEQADLRSQKMVQNLLLGTRNQALGTSLLVTGGFHTPEIAQLLREQKISYVVVSPKITHLRQGSGGQAEYLNVFSRDKTPLDRLFAGEKLFLASSNLAVGTPAAGAVNQLEQAITAFEQNSGSNSLDVGGKNYELSRDTGEGDGVVFHVTRVNIEGKRHSIKFYAFFLAYILSLPYFIVHECGHAFASWILGREFSVVLLPYKLADPTFIDAQGFNMEGWEFAPRVILNPALTLRDGEYRNAVHALIISPMGWVFEAVPVLLSVLSILVGGTNHNAFFFVVGIVGFVFYVVYRIVVEIILDGSPSGDLVGIRRAWRIFRSGPPGPPTSFLPLMTLKSTYFVGRWFYGWWYRNQPEKWANFSETEQSRYISENFAPRWESLGHAKEGFIDRHENVTDKARDEMEYGQSLIREGIRIGRAEGKIKGFAFGMRVGTIFLATFLVGAVLMYFHPSDYDHVLEIILAVLGAASVLSPPIGKLLGGLVGGWRGGVTGHKNYNATLSQEEHKAMEEGAEWLADLGAALARKDYAALVRVQPVGVGDLGRAQFDNEAALVAQLDKWILNDSFRELLIAGIKGRLGGRKDHPQLSPEQLNEVVDMLTAMVVGKGSGASAPKQTVETDSTLFLFEKSAEQKPNENLTRVRVMAGILKSGLRNPQVLADEFTFNTVQEAVRLLQNFGLIDRKVDVERVNSDRLKTLTIAELQARASLLIVSEERKKKEGSNNGRVVSHEQFIPIDNLHLDNIGRFLRAVLMAA